MGRTCWSPGEFVGGNPAGVCQCVTGNLGILSANVRDARTGWSVSSASITLYRRGLMQLIHSNALDAVRRVQGFLDSQAATLGAVVTATLRGRLDAAVTQLDAFKVARGAAIDRARGETTNEAAI